jgi:hypothetical protein
MVMHGLPHHDDDKEGGTEHGDVPGMAVAGSEATNTSWGCFGHSLSLATATLCCSLDW